jgi:stage V sporulation protein B
MAKKSFLSGAIILMVAGLIVRVLGFYYRIYLSNLIGAEGMGLFQLISPVYSLIILTLTSGISIAVSKMVSEEMARNHFVNLRRITSCALWIVVISGTIVSAFILWKIDFITNVILKDSRTYYSMMLLVPSIPFIAAASAMKGYFYGIQDVTPTAYSQIVEQIVRIGIVMLTAGHLVKLGLEYACAVAVVGMSLGEMSNMAVLWILYIHRKNKERRSISRYGFLRKRVIVKNIISTSVPVSANRFITSVMGAIEMILIPRMMVAGGMDYQSSISIFGKLMGMASPLVFFPSIVTSSLATTLVPAISEAMSTRSFKSANYRISKSIQLTFIIGFIFTAIFLVYPNEIGSAIYRRENIGELLYMLSYTSIFLYLQQTLIGVLNGLGKQGIYLRNSIIGYTIRIGFVYFLVPVYGINSYIWGVIVSSACVCILNLYTVVKTTGMALDIRNWIIKPGFVCVIMLLTGKYIFSFFSIFTSTARLNTVTAVFGNFIIALMLMFVVGALNIDELRKMLNFKKR